MRKREVNHSESEWCHSGNFIKRCWYSGKGQYALGGRYIGGILRGCRTTYVNTVILTGYNLQDIRVYKTLGDSHRQLSSFAVIYDVGR